MSQSWVGLLLLFTVAGLLNTAVFALCFLLTDDLLSFYDAFNLSAQSFLTIGYGTLRPRTTAAGTGWR